MSILTFEEWLVKKDFEEPITKPKEKEVLTENFNSVKWIKRVNSAIVISAGQSTSGVSCFPLDTTFEEKNMEKLECVQRGLTRIARGAGEPLEPGMLEEPGNDRPGKSKT